MLNLIRSIIPPIISLIILNMGLGLFMTFVSIRLSLEGSSTKMIGYVTAAYFAGLILGSIRTNKLIERIGHIRAFATFASLITAFIMIQAIFINPLGWLVLRFLSGICIAGLLIAIESWLLAKSTIETKGKILSIYMIAFYASQCLGQFLLDLSDPKSIIPFGIAIILTSLSIFPICMTHVAAPIIEEPSYLNFFQLLKISPLGVIGSIFSGIILGAFYGLGPIFAQELGLSISKIAQIMGITIFGGFVLQWPIGHFSDKIDRRKVLFFVSLLTTILSIVIAMLNSFSYSSLLIMMFLFGGFCFTIYPLSITHTSDLLDPKDIVAATAALAIGYSIGAIIGPIFSSHIMAIIGPDGLFYFFAVFAIILSIYALWKSWKSLPVAEEEKVKYRNAPRTTPIAHELDPRVDEKEALPETEEKEDKSN